MTAPDARQSDELRELIAEALSTTTTCHGEVWPSEFHYRQVDAILPVVTAWHEKAAEAQARARAASELRAAAEELHVARFNADADPEVRWPAGTPRVAPDSFYRGITVAELALKFRAGALTVAPPLTRAPARVDSGVTTQGNVPGGEGDR